MRGPDVRAARLREALDTYLAIPGRSLRKLSQASGVAPGNLNRAKRTGAGLGRVTAERLAPHLGVSASYLLGTDEPAALTPDVARKIKLRAWLAWWQSLPEELWPELKKYGDTLAAARMASRGRTTQGVDRKRTPKNTLGKVPKLGTGR